MLQIQNFFKALNLRNFELEGQGHGTIMKVTSPLTEILGLPCSIEKLIKYPFSKLSRRRCAEAAWCRCVRTAFGDDVLKTTIEEGNMCARAAKQRHRPAEPTQFRRKVAETADLAETAALLKNIHFLQLAYRKHPLTIEVDCVFAGVKLISPTDNWNISC